MVNGVVWWSEGGAPVYGKVVVVVMVVVVEVSRGESRAGRAGGGSGRGGTWMGTGLGGGRKRWAGLLGLYGLGLGRVGRR